MQDQFTFDSDGNLWLVWISQDVDWATGTSEIIKFEVTESSVTIALRQSVEHQLGTIYEYQNYMLIGASKAGSISLTSSEWAL
jgi:hypothetical protein